MHSPITSLINLLLLALSVFRGTLGKHSVAPPGLGFGPSFAWRHLSAEEKAGPALEILLDECIADVAGAWDVLCDGCYAVM